MTYGNAFNADTKTKASCLLTAVTSFSFIAMFTIVSKVMAPLQAPTAALQAGQTQFYHPAKFLLHKNSWYNHCLARGVRKIIYFCLDKNAATFFLCVVVSFSQRKGPRLASCYWPILFKHNYTSAIKSMYTRSSHSRRVGIDLSLTSYFFVCFVVSFSHRKGPRLASCYWPILFKHIRSINNICNRKSQSWCKFY